MPFIQNWPDFLHHTARLRSSPSVVDLFHNCIVNYKLIPVLPKVMPNAVNSSESSTVVLLLGHPPFMPSVVLHYGLMSWYPCDTNIISIRRFVKISWTVIYLPGSHYIRIQCLAMGMYGRDYLPVNIFVHNNFNRSLNCRYFRLKDAADDPDVKLQNCTVNLKACRDPK